MVLKGSGAQGADGPVTGASRVKCQVCGRALVPLADGTSRNHYAHRYPARIGRYDRSYCRGSGHRLARWEVGQELWHYSGDRWLVAEDRGGRWGDYWLRCLAGREQGREMVAHGEYMHRHGWTPCPPDLMAALEKSLSGLRPSTSGLPEHAEPETAELSPNSEDRALSSEPTRDEERAG